MFRIQTKSKWFLVIAALVVMTVVPLGSRVYADEKSPPPVRSSDDTYASFAPAAGVGNAQPITEPVTAPLSQKITLELKGVNVLDVLKILASRSGLNIVAGRDVRGEATLYLQDVEVRQALDTIVQTMGLAYAEVGGIITVMTNKEFESKFGHPFRDVRKTKTYQFQYANAQTVNSILQGIKSTGGTIAFDERTNTFMVTDTPEVLTKVDQAMALFDVPLVTKVFILKFAKAGDLEETFTDYLTPQVGILKVDTRSNQISVTDRQEAVSQIGELINAFDVRPRQVLIDAKVVEIQLFDAFRFGVDFDYIASNLGDVVKNVNLNPDLSVSAPSSSILGAGTLSTFTFGEGLNSDSARFNSVISVLQNIGKTNILSSPRILALNNEEAKLAVATRQPFVSQTVSQSQTISTTADQVDFVDVGVTLTVVPTITDDGNVILQVKPEVSTAGKPLELQGVSSGSNTTFTRTIVPVVTTQSLETTVVVKDGRTVVLGGLIQDKSAKTRKKVPILGSIPFIGAAFRTESNDFNKTELVIFLTPHIISGQTDSLEQKKYLDRNGNWVEFNKVGGYDFGKPESSTSQGAMRMNDKPYWKTPIRDNPEFIVPRDSALKAYANRDHVNDIMKLDKEGKEVVPDTYRAREQYHSMVHVAIVDELNRSQMFSEGKKEDFELFLIVNADGTLTMKQIGSDSGLSAKQKQILLETVTQLSPFPAFTSDMKSDQEFMDLKFELS